MSIQETIVKDSITGVNTYKTIPDGVVADLSTVQTMTNKTLDDTTTFFQNTTDTSKKAQFSLASIAALATRIFTFPNASGTVALTSDIPPVIVNEYAGARWESNATSSLGVLNQVNSIKGTFAAGSYLSSGFTIDVNNGFVYSGANRTFKVTYTATPTATSTNRTVWVDAWLNPSAQLNPTGSRIIGSRGIGIVSNSINDTQTISCTFYVALVATDIVQFFVSNRENANAITVSDFSVMIEAI